MIFHPLHNRKRTFLKITVCFIVGFSLGIILLHLSSPPSKPGLDWIDNIPSTPRYIKPTPLQKMLATTGKLEINLISGLWQSSNAGTAVAVLNHEGWTYYLTNKHVVEKMIVDKEEHELEILGLFSTDPVENITSYRHIRKQAFLVYAGKRLDLAIIKIRGNFPTATLAPQPPKLLDSITVIGAPYAVFPIITQGYITDFNVEVLGQNKCMLMSVASGPGNSGSPVFLNDGTLVGILFAGITKYPNISFALGIESIKVFLKEAVQTPSGKVFRQIVDEFPPSVETVIPQTVVRPQSELFWY